MHDGLKYAVGDSIEVDAETAQRLIASRSIDATPEAPSAPEAPVNAAERLAAIAGAISTLDKQNAKLWTSGGKPQVSAIETVIGWQVSAGERDAAWASLGQV